MRAKLRLKCESCGKFFELGKNASVMTDKVAMSMMKNAVVIGIVGKKPPIDAIYPANESDWTSALRRTTEESLEEIQNDLSAGRSRRWNCRACGREQDYTDIDPKECIKKAWWQFWR